MQGVCNLPNKFNLYLIKNKKNYLSILNGLLYDCLTFQSWAPILIVAWMPSFQMTTGFNLKKIICTVTIWIPDSIGVWYSNGDHKQAFSVRFSDHQIYHLYTSLVLYSDCYFIVVIVVSNFVLDRINWIYKLNYFIGCALSQQDLQVWCIYHTSCALSTNLMSCYSTLRVPGKKQYPVFKNTN